MSYQNLYTGRLSEPGRAYFITTVTQHRNPIFEDINCARIVINHMRKIHDAEWVSSLSWVVMPDHVHWLFRLGDTKELSAVLKHFKARSAIELNQALKRSGSIWQSHYYDRAIRDGEDIRQIARYIVGNPLRAGLVKNIFHYPHWDAAWL